MWNEPYRVSMVWRVEAHRSELHDAVPAAWSPAIAGHGEAADGNLGLTLNDSR